MHAHAYLYKLTTLSIEEHEGFVEGEGVVIRRWVVVAVARHHLHDKGDEASQQSGKDDNSEGPLEYLPAYNYATQVHVFLLLLLLRRAQQPALLRLIQRPRQRRPVQLLQIPAPLLVSGRLAGMDLQRPTPRISNVNTHFSSLY